LDTESQGGRGDRIQGCFTQEGSHGKSLRLAGGGCHWEFPEGFGGKSGGGLLGERRSVNLTCLMPRESKEAKAARVKKIIAGLKKTYPGAHCELNYSKPLELLIATILSAQCTDKRVNIVTAELFKKYRSAADFANAPLAALEQEVRTTGFFRNKAKSIKTACQAIVEQHGGQVPRTMEELTQLGGVGRKTANVVLGNAFNISCGVVVDTHVARLAYRLGLTREKNPEKIEQELMALVPQSEWTLFSHLLIWHGRRRCYARSPDCPQCEIKALCPRVGVGVLKRRENHETH
jgi:endonuclease-3